MISFQSRQLTDLSGQIINRINNNWDDGELEDKMARQITQIGTEGKWAEFFLYFAFDNNLPYSPDVHNIIKWDIFSFHRRQWCWQIANIKYLYFMPPPPKQTKTRTIQWERECNQKYIERNISLHYVHKWCSVMPTWFSWPDTDLVDGFSDV